MVIDESPACGPQVGAELAPLAGVLEQPYRQLEEHLGPERARAAAQGFSCAIDAIEAIVRRERIACEFERLDGYWLSTAQDARSELEREVGCATRAGLREVELVGAPPIQGASGAPCVRYPGHALLHPGKFAAGLARAIRHEGGRLHCGVRARAIEVGRVASLLTSAGHRIQADIVVAPGAPSAPSGANAGAIAHVIGLRVPRGAVTRALYWDGSRRYCARLRAQGMRTADVLLVGARGDDALDAAAQYEALEGWARRHFPCAAEVVQRFSGERLRTADVFAFAGRDVADSESVYVSDASWGTAMSRAATAGIAIKEFVEGARAPEAGLRIPGASATGATPSARAREFA